MSQSEYKTKITHQRSRPAKPYERNNKNLVNKVKNWAYSWFSSPTTTSDAGPSTSSRGNSKQHSSPPLFQDHSTAPPLLSNSTTPNDGLTGDPMTPDNTAPPTSFVSAAITGNRSKNNRITTANLRTTLSMFEEVLADTPAPIDVSTSSSNDSWVAEDVEEEQEPDGPQSEPNSPQSEPGMSMEDAPTQQTHVVGDQTASVGVGRAAQVGSSELKEHTVTLVTNPVFSNGQPSTGSSADVGSSPGSSSTFSGGKVRLTQKVTSGFSAELSRRLYSTPAVVTSTPQLSPVHERQEDELQSSVRGVASPFRPVLPTPPLSLTVDQRTTGSAVSGLTTPARAYTSESISRSPFRSPFYSGRTSFGGAASQQKMKVKRPRTESSPPVLAPLRVSVRATPKPSSAQSVVSQTAKRIMDTLNSLTSPLSDARKMPMRGVPPEMQQAKRRRVSGGSSSILSPPPVTPLQSTKSQTPQIVPSERPSPRKSLVTTSMDYTDSSIPLSPCTATPTKPTSKVTTSQFSLLSTDHTPSALSGLKFFAPPLTSQQTSPEQSSSSFSGRSSQAPPPRMKTISAGGKMTRHPRRRRSSGMEEEEQYTNPVTPPPRVGLSLSQGGSLPSFTFHSQLMSDKGPSPPKLPFASKPLTQQSSSSILTFSFSKPVPMSADSAVSADTPPKMSFGFSIPKPHLSTSTATAPPQLTSLTTLPKPIINFGQRPPSKPSPNPPPLKNMSVTDALKKPEYNQFLKSTSPHGTSAKAPDVVDLTESDDEDTPSTAQKQPSLKPLPQFAPSAGSWSCEVCFVSNKVSDLKCVACNADKPGGKSAPKSGVLQLGSSSGLKLGGPGLKLPTATASKPFPQLGPPAGSWECTTCFVTNKSSDNKCVACSASKPSSSSSLLAGEAKSRSSIFPALAPPSDSWTCDTCLVPNKAQDVKCVACSTAKPGATQGKDTVPGTGLSLSSTGGLKLGGGISLGRGQTLGTRSALDGTLSSGSGFKLGGDVSLGTGLKLGTGTSFGGGQTSSDDSGFKLGSGVSLGSSQLQPLPSLALTKESKDSWSCDTCLVVNKPDASSCIACTAPKPGNVQASTTLTLGTSGGFKLGGALSAPKPKPSTDSSQPAPSSDTGVSVSKSAQWTCSTCWVPNKAEASMCVACGESKPGDKSTAEKKNGTTPGLQLGSVGDGFKLGAGNLMAPLSAAAGVSSLTPIITSTTEASGKDGTAAPKPSIQFGVPSTSTSGFKLGGPLFPDNKQATDSPLSGIKLGGSSQTASNPLSGIKLGTGSFGSNPRTTASSLTTAVTSNPLSGIKFGGTGSSGISLGGSSGAPIARGGSTAATSGAPLTGIKLGGALATTSSSSNSPLTGITLGSGPTLGSGLTVGGSTLTLGQSAVTTASNSARTEIKLGATQTSNPLTGIKLGGSLASTPTTGSLSTGGLQSQAPVAPKLQFAFGNSGNASSLGTFKFSGAQQTETSQAPSLQFPASSAGSVFGVNTPSTITSAAPKFTPTFGVPQSGLSLGTPAPAEDLSQAEMQSPDNEMNVEQTKPEQSMMPSLMFGPTKPQTASNIFGGQANPTQSSSTFSFTASNVSGAFGVTSTKPSFNFGAGSASNFSFTGGAPSQPATTSTAAGPESAFPPAHPNTGTAQGSSSSGYNFTANSGLNLNFGSMQQQSPQVSSFSVGSSSTTPGGRVIRKARRRK